MSGQLPMPTITVRTRALHGGGRVVLLRSRGGEEVLTADVAARLAIDLMTCAEEARRDV